MADVVMPRLSDTMEQGTVARWLKREGERVATGEPLAEIETDKANLVLEAYESGVIERIVVPEGKMVPIGEPIAYIAAEREAGGAPQPVSKPPEVPSAGKIPAPHPPAKPAEVAEGERIKASPIARRIAQEHDLDLAAIRGTGPGGRITREDVERVLETKVSPAPTPSRPSIAPPGVLPVEEGHPPAVELVPLSRMQATIARRMAESKATVPHFYVTNTVQMDAALEMRSSLNSLPEVTQEGRVKIGVNDLIVRASALALRRFPEVNASYQDGQVAYHKEINIGIAVALPRGLIVPVLREADRKSLAEIARESSELIEKARTNRLAPREWENGTFTVSNMGMYDVDEFQAIITPPQSAIVAVGSIRPTPAVVEGQVNIIQIAKASISADHRVFYGATAAEFLREMKRLLEQPLLLLL